MLHISVCDDEPAQLMMLEKMVGEWAGERNAEVKVALNRNSDQFLFEWEEKKETDILLLDIEMPGMDGIALARKLRKIGETLQIIFVTGMEDYALEGYDVDAVSYLLKPIDRERLFSCLDRARQRRNKAEPAILLDTVEGLVRVKVMDIRYIESMAHETRVHCLGAFGEIQCKTGISQMEKALEGLSHGFYRIHRSYLVNMAHIEKITKKEVLIEASCGSLIAAKPSTARSLPIARGKWEGLNSSYLSYYRKRGMDFI